MKKTIVTSAIGALALSALSTGAMAADTAACLITKNNTNPFFVKMKEGAEAKAKEAGIALAPTPVKLMGMLAHRSLQLKTAWLRVPKAS